MLWFIQPNLKIGLASSTLIFTNKKKELVAGDRIVMSTNPASPSVYTIQSIGSRGVGAMSGRNYVKARAIRSAVLVTT